MEIFGIMSFLDSGEPAKPATAEDAFRMGRDCALNGPDEHNCDFRLFATPELADAWSRGKQSLG